MSSEDGPRDCPVCFEELDATDRNFKPCKCGYQVCLWCWHSIKEKLRGRCPNCRTPYDDTNIQFTAPDPAEIQRQLSAGKQKKRGVRGASISGGGGGGGSGGGIPFRPPVAPDRAKLQDVRVLQRCLCYVVGLPLSIAREETLKRKEHFGRFGKIIKIAVNRKQAHPSSDTRSATCSAYVTFRQSADATEAIKAMNGTFIEGRMLKASYGTTKYCSYFLRHMVCNNPGCLYLHELAKSEDCFTKEDLLNHEKFEPEISSTAATDNSMGSLNSAQATLLEEEEYDEREQDAEDAKEQEKIAAAEKPSSSPVDSVSSWSSAVRRDEIPTRSSPEFENTDAATVDTFPGATERKRSAPEHSSIIVPGAQSLGPTVGKPVESSHGLFGARLNPLVTERAASTGAININPSPHLTDFQSSAGNAASTGGGGGSFSLFGPTIGRPNPSASPKSRVVGPSPSVISRPPPGFVDPLERPQPPRFDVGLPVDPAQSAMGSMSAALSSSLSSSATNETCLPMFSVPVSTLRQPIITHDAPSDQSETYRFDFNRFFEELKSSPAPLAPLPGIQGLRDSNRSNTSSFGWADPALQTVGPSLARDASASASRSRYAFASTDTDESEGILNLHQAAPLSSAASSSGSAAAASPSPLDWQSSLRAVFPNVNLSFDRPLVGRSSTDTGNSTININISTSQTASSQASSAFPSGSRLTLWAPQAPLQDPSSYPPPIPDVSRVAPVSVGVPAAAGRFRDPAIVAINKPYPDPATTVQPTTTTDTVLSTTVTAQPAVTDASGSQTGGAIVATSSNSGKRKNKTKGSSATSVGPIEPANNTNGFGQGGDSTSPELLPPASSSSRKDPAGASSSTSIAQNFNVNVNVNVNLPPGLYHSSKNSSEALFLAHSKGPNTDELHNYYQTSFNEFVNTSTNSHQVQHLEREVESARQKANALMMQVAQAQERLGLPKVP